MADQIMKKEDDAEKKVEEVLAANDSDKEEAKAEETKSEEKKEAKPAVSKEPFKNLHVIVVTSGAVGLGKKKLNLR